MARLGAKLRDAARQHGPMIAFKGLKEAWAGGKGTPADVSFRELAQGMMGDSWALDLKRLADQRRGQLGEVPVEEIFQRREASDAVDASNFQAITGQLLVDRIRQQYELATQVGREMFDDMPITNGNLGTQREPWLGRVADIVPIVQQGMPYPTAKFDAQYVDYPAPNKYGEICNVTFEAVYSDLTGQINRSADSVGEMTGLRGEEFPKLAVALGLVNNHNWNGTAYNTYLTTGAWINDINNATFTNWRDENAVQQLFNQMLDPSTGLPINVQAKDAFFMPAYLALGKRVLNATMVREGDITTGAGTQTGEQNPIETNYRIMTSKNARFIAVNGINNGANGTIAGYTNAARADSVTLWGDFKRAFGWRSVYPLQVVQAPPQNPLEFNQDIVLSMKASVYGVAVVKDPRYVVRYYNNSL